MQGVDTVLAHVAMAPVVHLITGAVDCKGKVDGAHEVDEVEAGHARMCRGQLKRAFYGRLRGRCGQKCAELELSMRGGGENHACETSVQFCV